MSGDDEARSTESDGSVERPTALSTRALAVVLGVSQSTIMRDKQLQPQTSVSEGGDLLVPFTEGIDGKVRQAVRYNTSGRDALILTRHQEGHSMRSIATEVGCSVGTVHRVVNR